MGLASWFRDHWPPWRPPAPAPPPTDNEAALVLAEVNALRRQYSKAPLIWHEDLAAECAGHSEAMARTGQLSHAGWQDRLARCGFASGGENLAMGPRTAAEVVKLWAGSAGHKANLLGAYTYLGCGVAQGPGGDPYWTLLVA